MRRILPAWLLTCLLLLPLVAWSQEQDPTPTPEQLRAQLADAGMALDKAEDDAALIAERDRLGTIQEQARRAIAARTPQLESLDARLAELAADPDQAGGEAREVTRERDRLQDERNALDAELRQARLVQVESGQLLERVSGIRQDRFRAALWERRTPPYLPGFWRDLARTSPQDSQRLDGMWQELRKAGQTASAAPGRLALLVGFALAIALLAWLLIRRGVPALAGRWLPPGRLRRSAAALASVAIATLATACSITLLRHLLGTAPPPRVDALAGSVVGGAILAAIVASLGSVLISAQRPSWRLPAISDAAAQALRPLPWAAALVMALLAVGERFAALINASLSLTVAITTVGAVLALGIVLVALFRIRRLQVAGTSVDAPDLHFTPWINVAVAIGWTIAGLTTLALLSGFIAFAAFAIRQLLWTVTVLSALYLLMRAADDLITAVLTSKGPAGRRLHTRFGLDSSRIDQTAVVLSGVIRVFMILLALIALAAAYGASGDSLIERVVGLLGGITIGELVLSPGVIVRAVLVFAGAIVVFRLLQHWFGHRYLPTTRLEPGMQGSMVALFGYAGVVVAVAMALAAIGVGVERIAWIASALSVGIGFGLQAIVQNFISGLILLAERPVKVGDWVVVGDAEGDIRRINVRATEIQTGDRTTILVPNSEFITKTVRNRTYANAEGLVKVQLPMPLGTDADLFRDLVLEAFREHPGILDAPAPSVVIDGIDNGRILFSATGFVSTPRQAGGTRSAILFEVLRRMREFGIKMQ